MFGRVAIHKLYTLLQNQIFSLREENYSLKFL